jgi:hypothetical protein
LERQDLQAPWIDERQRAIVNRPWRKIHLDFQMQERTGRVGADFNPGDFQKTLIEARVSAVVLHAKNTYGYCFFPSKLGPVHPGLEGRDLLGSQIAACRDAGIKAYAYYSYAWDEFLATRHPEWLVWKRDRTTYLPPLEEPSLWSALCLSHDELMDIALEHTSEILDAYPVDGVWYDMVYPKGAECYCWRCLAAIEDSGDDPLDVAAQRRHKDALHLSVVRRLFDHARRCVPNIEVEFNTQATLGLGNRASYVSNVDIEALPTGGWGYMYFPVHARFARTAGLSVYGMTGRFHTAWGDYGGLKHPKQLQIELAGILAVGARCDIGDQPLPSGRLDAATFATIGDAFREIEQLEDYLEGAVSVTEAAIIVNGPPLSHLVRLGPSPEAFPSIHASSVSGYSKLLMEAHIQFDVLEEEDQFERYRLIVLPDSLEVDESLAERLRAFAKSGGAVLACRNALRIAGTDRLWPQELRDALDGVSPFQPAFTRIASDLLPDSPQYSGYAFAIYGEADRWRVTPDGVKVLGLLTEASYQQWQAGWQSAPPETDTDWATIVQTGNVAACAFDLGTQYFTTGYWFYRDVFLKLVQRILPLPIVTTNAPMSAEVTLTHQAATSERAARWIVHIVNYSPLRRGEGIEFHEDPVALHDVWIGLNLDVDVASVTEVRTGAPLEFSRKNDRWEAFVLPFSIAAMVAFEEAG